MSTMNPTSNQMTFDLECRPTTCRHSSFRTMKTSSRKLDVRKPEAERPKNDILFPLVHIASICFAHAVADEWIVAHLLRFTVDGMDSLYVLCSLSQFLVPYLIREGILF
ncbi:hypothetical protein MPTK1_5g04080 [Marchantia polymorpha subsp. ruderalis]|uniref:Uncharacterized protein n=2 Tax=Marchantia polymorpha TaxID=3197 RepID=A0AAF6BES1_MARPO|nr:hypothetical protein MARPO_0141s0016 [Marchantia polymorpha]BBN10505.1 hypothetical protein Mp_5g04080 [Marchantia polymorpha subsp. ruderalis]|eukprot:PTQ29435.1 hypothetical protein MARPO_0141s0016 [Marchantia polymorpha]